MRTPAILLAAALAPALPACGRRDPSPAAPPARPLFIDATAACGLDFVHYNGATGEYYLPEIMGAGCAVLDHDGDGDLDVYAVQGALLGAGKTLDDSLFPPRDRPPRNRLFRNRLVDSGAGGGRLEFADVTEASGTGDPGYGMGCAAGDYDNDGRPDLYVTNFGPNVLYHNEGGGVFRDATAGAGVAAGGFSASAAFLDCDRDGDLDLFVTAYVEYSLAANRDCFRLGGLRDYCGPLSYQPAPDRLYRNQGDGTFRDATAEAGIHDRQGCGLGVVGDDFNADGWIDIFVANDATPNQLWINRGDGTFADTALLAGAAVNAAGRNEASMGITAGDYDRDGDLDVFITHDTGETNTLYRQVAPGFFEDATAAAQLGYPSLPFTGFGTGWFDYDHDGWLDLFAANGSVRKLPGLLGQAFPYAQSHQLFHNREGRFVETSSAAGPAVTAASVGRGAAFGDLDNDGDIDIVLANNSGPLRVLLNQAGGSHHWLRLRLEGTRSNRDAYGARVAVRLPDGAVLRGRVAADGSYLSSNDKRVHFGLGGAARVESVTVHWPSGLVERWEGLPVDAETALREGQGTPVE
jgi:hypothetical protein